MSQSDSLSIEQVFSLLRDHFPKYEQRQQQLDLAQAIDYTFRSGKRGVFEAGTGTGKSLAALIPAVLSKKRVIISTNTIALQEQYLYKDIPVLQAVVPFTLNYALLKGRGNYIGLRRWEEALLEQEVDNRLIDWVQETDSGDISELDFVPPFSLWQEINSDHDDCLHNKCPRFRDCFYFEAKRQAEEADILLVNHALLMVDAVSRGTVLPSYDLLIVDEAHHLPDVATDVFSMSLSNGRIHRLASRALKKVMAPAGLVHEVEMVAEEFFRDLAGRFLAPKTRLKEPMEGAAEFAATLHMLRNWLDEQNFENLLDVNQAKERAKLKAKSLITTIDSLVGCLDLLANPDPDWVVWLSRKDLISNRVEIVAAPLDPSQQLGEALLSKPGLESTVFMSATLATVGEDPFQFFRERVGITSNYVQEAIASPFNYAKQALLYLPKGLPDPNDRSYLDLATDEIARILEFTQGRAFVLFTSHAAMNTAYEMLCHSLPYDCKKQGEMPKNKLVEWFLRAPQAVLFATASFWEGISIDGEKLSCVIIDRIPFQSPDDPIYEARCEAIKEVPGASWFKDLALPHATMRLKQGVGRLIRTAHDVGIVAILDTRLTSKSYGKRILECLPAMQIVHDVKDLENVAEQFGLISKN